MPRHVHPPSKEQVRAWFLRRHDPSVPVPDGEQIRRALGWGSEPQAAAQPPGLPALPARSVAKTD